MCFVHVLARMLLFLLTQLRADIHCHRHCGTLYSFSPRQMLKWNGKPAQTPPNVIPANRSSKHAPAGPQISYSYPYSYPYILYTSLYSSAYGSQVYPGLGTQKQRNLKS